MEQHFSRLIEKSEQYIKTTGELYKLKAIDKSAEVLASLTANLFVLISVTIFLLTLNIGIAFWLGTIIGEVYLGFFIVALFYLLYICPLILIISVGSNLRILSIIT